MKERTRERVSGWDSRPFSDGYRDLHALADDRFSGAAVTGGTHLFMLNGRVVGVYDGSIDAFDGASGSLYEAPDKALPLLFSMLESAGETQGKYYTNDTPLSETDETLSNANFTGYVELSENVLSGDYYTVYYGGKSMSAAFVGASEELVTGDEAYERADDEVGLYEVVKVGVDIVDIPEVESGSDASTAGGAAAGAATAAAETETGSSDGGFGEEPTDEATDAPTDVSNDAAVGQADDEPADNRESDRSESAADRTEGAAATERAAAADVEDSVSTSPVDIASASSLDGGEVESGDVSDAGARSHPSAGGESVSSDAGSTASTSSEHRPGEPESEPVADRPSARSASQSSEDAQSARDDRATSDSADRDRSTRTSAKPGETASQGVDERFAEEAAWRSTKSVPAIDPERSSTGDRDARETREAAERRRREQKRERRPQSQARPSDQSAARANGADAAGATRETLDGARERIQALEQAVRERDDRIDALERELEDADGQARVEELERELAAARERAAEAEAGSEDLAAVREKLESVRAERDRLQSRVEDLEARLAEATGSSANSMTAADAIAGTNLFVRYDSKADPTLDAVGRAPPEEVNQNLSLEHHTQFDESGVTVEGDPFEVFLESTPEYRFVSWVVRELPYEILDTGHRGGLGDVFDVVSEIDRAELHGTVTTEDEEGGEHVAEFDVVVRDRMGNPLLVADLNTSRDPVRAGEMESLVSAGRTVAGDASLGGAFYVTSSFFEPEALETASEATNAGGFLSRSDKESYVKVARKDGFHLCLVEDRNGTFHLTVPEL